MRRARYPMPPQLRDLTFNPLSSKYEIKENGILYKLNLEETRLLRDFFRHFHTDSGRDFPTVAAWYQKMKNDVRKKVEREGEIIQAPDGFYPDPQYWD